MVEQEYSAVLAGAGSAQIETDVICVTGRDRAPWLHKLVTADVEHRPVGQGARAALLEAKGHFASEFVLLSLPDAVLLLTTHGEGAALLQALRRYVFREKVSLADQSGAWRLVTIIGREAATAVRPLSQEPPSVPYSFVSVLSDESVLLIRSRRSLLPSFDILFPARAVELPDPVISSLPQLSPETLEVLRVEAGLPRWGVDFDSRTLALEIPDVLSVRVDQGCYIGQEVVARIVHRGHVNRLLVGLELEQLAARGEPVTADGQEVGHITSAVLSPRLGPRALAFINRAAAEPGTRVRVGHKPARVIGLPVAS